MYGVCGAVVALYCKVLLHCCTFAGVSVYFAAEAMSEGSCQPPRDENGSEESCGAPSSPPTPHLEERCV